MGLCVVMFFAFKLNVRYNELLVCMKRGASMQIEKFYEQSGGDYQGVLSRLMTPERVTKYVLKFADATDYNDLEKAIEEKDYEGAFRYSHNLKGVSLNLSFTRLQNSASELCEVFRSGEPACDYSQLWEKVKEDYKLIIDSINANNN